MRSLTWDEVWARRLARHGLTTPARRDRLAAQVEAICGAHAQVMSAAELSIGLRVEEITRAQIRSALWVERSLVKAFGPRGTVHLLAARDLPMWNAVLGAALVPPNFPPDVRMDEAQTDAVVGAIDDALAEADLTIDELSSQVVERAGAWAGERVMPAFGDLWPRWRVALSTAAFRGALCFGPNRGQKTTFTSPRRWLNGYRPEQPGRAARKLLRRYLHAYGPAAPEHLARWLGSTPSWADDLFRAARRDLQRVDVEAERLWQLTRDRHAEVASPAGIWLLPYFDAYVVGCQPRRRLFRGRAAARALTRGQAGNVPVLLVDGLVAGVWHQRRSGRGLAVTVDPFRRLTARQRGELEGHVERIGEVLEATAALSFGTVSAGPHA
jgi:Winged helix DNA-binding domain